MSLITQEGGCAPKLKESDPGVRMSALANVCVEHSSSLILALTLLPLCSQIPFQSTGSSVAFLLKMPELLPRMRKKALGLAQGSPCVSISCCASAPSCPFPRQDPFCCHRTSACAVSSSELLLLPHLLPDSHLSSRPYSPRHLTEESEPDY
jgi:hypothetical protein